VSKDILQIVKNQGSSIVFSASQELSKYIKNELYRLSPQYPVSLSIIDLDESDTFPFTSKDEIKLVLASQRGRFNEGIEFPQDIRNIIVFGLSITPPSLREQLFAKYILGCNTAHEIFTYGYLHPAVTVLVQSIGRLIRRGKKEINVYIFENRVFKESILKMMPQWFKEIISEYIDVPPA
jgi:Rad3-related DNA helicase